MNLSLFIRRNSDNLYWTGSGWGSVTNGFISNSYNSSTHTWQNTGALPAPGSSLGNGTYHFIAIAVDAAGNQQQVDSVVSVDFHPIYVFTYGSQSGLTPNMNWSDPANWDVGSVPTPDAHVIINAYSPDNTSLGSVQLYRLDLSGGSLTTVGMLISNLNVSGGTLNGGAISIPSGGTFNWSGGILAGACMVQTGAVANVSGAAPKDLADSAVLVNRGTMNWQGSGLIRANGYSDASYVTNLPGAIFQATADGPLFGQAYGYHTLVFANAGGVFAKTAGVGTNSVDTCQFINAGMVRCDSGVLAFNAQMELDAGGVFTGSATNRVAGGSLAVFGLTVVSNTVLDLNSGQFTGGGDGSGTFGTTGSGKLIWSGGVLNGTLTLAANARTEISGPDQKAFADNAVLNNHGQITWLNGTIEANGYSAPSYWNNFAGATFTIAGTNAASRYYGYQLGQFENQAGASLVVNTAGESLWDGWQLINDGVLSGVAGRLNLAQGGTAAGTFTNLLGSEVDFSAGTFLLHGGARFVGAGTTRIAGATVTADGPVTSSASSDFQFDSGVLGGAGFASSGKFHWNGGTLGGTCSNAVGGVFTMTGSNAMVLADSAVFNNYGQVTWLNGTIYANGYSAPSYWNNFAGATFTIAGTNAASRYNGYQLGQFESQAGAALVVNTAGESLWDGWQLINDGVLSGVAGRLNLAQGGTATGTFTNLLGSEVDFSAGTFLLHGGARFAGAGTTRIAGATVTVDGPVTSSASSDFQFDSGVLGGSGFASSGKFHWNGGTLGTCSNAVGGVFTMTGSNAMVLADSAVFNNNGTAQLLNALLLVNGYSDVSTWNNLSGSLFNVSSDGSVFGQINGYHNLIFNNFARSAVGQNRRNQLCSGFRDAEQLGQSRLRQRRADL